MCTRTATLTAFEQRQFNVLEQRHLIRSNSDISIRLNIDTITIEHRHTHARTSTKYRAGTETFEHRHEQRRNNDNFKRWNIDSHHERTSTKLRWNIDKVRWNSDTVLVLFFFVDVPAHFVDVPAQFCRWSWDGWSVVSMFQRRLSLFQRRFLSMFVTFFPMRCSSVDTRHGH